ncbi:MAG: hypothetical protein MJ149_01130, partial [Clostridia bacterium]|nr:hypothetical protein [Clostridia bacterium]
MICCVVSWAINAISSRASNKNITRSIMSIIFTVVIIFFVYIANDKTFAMALGGEVKLWFKIIFANVYFGYLSIVDASFINMLIMIAVSIIYAGLSLLMLIMGYNKINKRLNIVKKSKKNKPLVFKQKSPVISMLHREFSTYLLSPV